MNFPIDFSKEGEYNIPCSTVVGGYNEIVAYMVGQLYGDVAYLVERARLEIVYTSKGYREFESLHLRQKKPTV